MQHRLIRPESPSGKIACTCGEVFATKDAAFAHSEAKAKEE